MATSQFFASHTFLPTLILPTPDNLMLRRFYPVTKGGWQVELAIVEQIP